MGPDPSPLPLIPPHSPPRLPTPRWPRTQPPWTVRETSWPDRLAKTRRLRTMARPAPPPQGGAGRRRIPSSRSCPTNGPAPTSVPRLNSSRRPAFCRRTCGRVSRSDVAAGARKLGRHPTGKLWTPSDVPCDPILLRPLLERVLHGSHRWANLKIQSGGSCGSSAGSRRRRSPGGIDGLWLLGWQCAATKSAEGVTQQFRALLPGQRDRAR